MHGVSGEPIPAGRRPALGPVRGIGGRQVSGCCLAVDIRVQAAGLDVRVPDNPGRSAEGGADGAG